MAKAKEPAKKTTKPDRWFEPAKPEFIKLEVGETIEGIYIGRQSSQFGPVYRFQNGQKMLALSGNRVSIDGIMDQVEAANMKGHFLVVERRNNEQSQRGRTVHQYRVGHIPDGCPQCDRRG